MFIEKPQAYLAIPFGVKPAPSGDVDYDPIFERITDTLASLGVESVRADPSDPSAQSQVERVRRSDMVIAEITGSNPTVMIAVGMALGLSKPLLLLSQSRSGDVLFDLQAHQIAVYSSSDLASVGTYVELMVRDALARRESSR